VPEEGYVGVGYWLGEYYVAEEGVGVEECDEGVGVYSLIGAIIFFVNIVVVGSIGILELECG